jgi:hypothetical protein
MAVAAQRLFEEQAERVASMLEESGRRLHPLGKPLATDFAVHRWLAGDREEAYSDWLQWVLLQLHDPDDVLRLLGVNERVDWSGWRGGPPEVNRELPVPEGHEGQGGRLDLLVRYTGIAVLVVEVKKTGADEADTAKQAGYLAWFRGQPEPHRLPILLATEAEEDLYEGFRFLPWSELCLGLRRVARDRLGDGKGVVAALTLAFAGAVEQNLLGFSAPRARRHHPAGVNPRLTGYLERWLSD